jgi:hypothetical protein
VVRTCGDVSVTWSPATRRFLARLIFDPEEGGDTVLQNVCPHTDYTAIYPRIWIHSGPIMTLLLCVLVCGSRNFFLPSRCLAIALEIHRDTRDDGRVLGIKPLRWARGFFFFFFCRKAQFIRKL